MLSLHGIIPAMITPLTQDQQVNEDALRRMVNHLIGAGAHAIFTLGTNGEFFSLTYAERLRVTEVVIEEVAGRVPVMVGTGVAGTHETVEFSKAAQRMGADCLSVISPYFNALSQREVAGHFRRAAQAVSIPVLLYNIPARTGVDIAPETLQELARIPNIVGIKDSSGKFDTIRAYIDATQGMDFGVYAGTDSLILQTLQAGGKGAVAATANVLPDVAVALYESFRAGDITAAQAAQEKLCELRKIIPLGSIPAAFKAAVTLQGIEAGPPRLPVEPVGEEALAQIRALLAGLCAR